MILTSTFVRCSIQRVNLGINQARNCERDLNSQKKYETDDFQGDVSIPNKVGRQAYAIGQNIGAIRLKTT